MKDNSKFWHRLQSHQWAALAIAVVVVLADTVIVYDLWLAGSWLTNDYLSGAKTAAFIILFIGALIAEMQDLQKGTRILLIVGVVLLGIYQATINVVANYHDATIPQSAASLFAPHLSAMQVRIGYSVVDGIVRTTVVIIMWLVTGLVWRGLATGESASSEEVAEVQAAYDELKAAHILEVEQNSTLQAERDAAQSVATSVQAFRNLEPEKQVKVIAQCRNGDNPTNQELATWYDVSPSTIGRWISKEEN